MALSVTDNIRAAWHGRFSGGCDYCALDVGRSYPTIIGAARPVALTVLVSTIIGTNYPWRITVPTWPERGHQCQRAWAVRPGYFFLNTLRVYHITCYMSIEARNESDRQGEICYAGCGLTSGQSGKGQKFLMFRRFGTFASH